MNNIPDIAKAVNAGWVTKAEVVAIESKAYGWRAGLDVSVLTTVRKMAATEKEAWAGLTPVKVAPVVIACQLAIRPREIVESLHRLAMANFLLPRAFCRRPHLEMGLHPFYVPPSPIYEFDTPPADS